MTEQSSAQDVLAQARKFADEELRPRARQTDLEGRLPKEVLAAMGERRYLGATFPQEYGGLGLDPLLYGQLTEIIGTACPNTRALLTLQTSLVGESLLRWGTKEQVSLLIPKLARGEKLAAFALSEPDIGTDAGGIKTSYVREGGAFVISGVKKWITFGTIADVYLVFARNEDGITCFLVDRDTPGVDAQPMDGLLGMRGCHVSRIDFERVRVPAANVVGAEGSGMRFVASTALDHGRYSIAWAGTAVCRAALDAMVAYARHREQFGKKLSEYQLIQRHVANGLTDLYACRALCLKAGEARRARTAEASMETMIAKYFTSHAALRVASNAVQVLGGNGCWNGFPAERLFREAKILQIIEGTSEIHQQLIGKHALKRFPAGALPL